MIKQCFFIIFLILTAHIFCEEDMDTIVITAEVEEDSTKSQTSTITNEEIKALPGATTAELVASVMGVKLSKTGNESQPSFISIRGSSPEQVLVLLNGKRLNSSQGGGVDLSKIPVESIEKIEVTRGGNSAIYGGSAFGGIVNITTNQTNKTDVTVNYGYGSDSKNELTVTGAKTFKDSLSISSTLKGLYTKGDYEYEGRDETLERLNSDIKSFYGSLNIDWLIHDKFEIFSNTHVNSSDRGVPGLVEFPTNSARMEDNWFSTTLGVNYLESVSYDIYFQSKDRVYKDPENITGEIDDNHNYRSISSLLSVKEEFLIRDMELNGQLDISSSYDYLESSNYDNDGKADRLTHSLFISTELLYKSLTVQPSGRIDFQEDNKQFYSWNFGSVFDLDKKKSYKLKANIGNAYRLPGFDDMFWPESSFAVGNPDLKHESAYIYDIGFIANTPWNIKLETTLYYHDVYDLIEWNPGPGGKWSPINMGRAEIKGIESEISYLVESESLRGFFEGRVNYTYMSALNKTEGILYNKELINRSMHKGNLIIIYNHVSGKVFSVDGSYTGDKYITAANTKIFPHYILVDLNTSIPIGKSFKLHSYVKNILNETYQDYRGFPVPGITFGVNFEYRMQNNE